MRLGILTSHHSENFGAVLQTLSLQSLLASWGHDVSVLNHASDQCHPWARWRDPQGRFVNPLERIRGLLHQRRFRGDFSRFRNQHLKLTPPLSDPHGLAEAARSLDGIITGSDQVWHFSREPRYFLHWDPPFSGRKISYAASCGTDSQPEGNGREIGSWIRSFHAVSVRDDFSAKLISKITGREPVVVADPTLLVDPGSWVQCPANLPSDYYLLYHLGPPSADLALWMHQIQRQQGHAPWVWLNGHADRIPRPPPAEFRRWHAAPETWLGAIQNCRALLTDSFHGILYALQFQKPFLILASDRFRRARLLDLIQRYDLAGHLLPPWPPAGQIPGAQPSANTRIKIQAHVEMSLGFLRRALSTP